MHTCLINVHTSFQKNLSDPKRYTLTLNFTHTNTHKHPILTLKVMTAIFLLLLVCSLFLIILTSGQVKIQDGSQEGFVPV